MRPYLAILRTRYLLLLQYRAAAIAGLFTQTFFGLVRIMVLEGFYASSTVTPPMTHAQIISYVWLGQAFLLLIPWSIDGEIRATIRSGSVAYELVRPLDLYAAWFFRCIAQRIAPTSLRALPMITIAMAFFGMSLPPTPAAGAAWVLSTIAAVLLAAAITTLTTITLMWTVAGEGAARLLPALSYFGAGLIIPLPMFPQWAQTILYILPFRGLMDTPFRLYTGHIPPTDAAAVIAHQFLWTLVLIAVGRFLLNRGLKRLVVQGG